MNLEWKKKEGDDEHRGGGEKREGKKPLPVFKPKPPASDYSPPLHCKLPWSQCDALSTIQWVQLREGAQRSRYLHNSLCRRKQDLCWVPAHVLTHGGDAPVVTVPSTHRSNWSWYGWNCHGRMQVSSCGVMVPWLTEGLCCWRISVAK